MTNDLTGITVNGITFDATAGAFKLQGNAVTLGGTITINSTDTQTINLPLALLVTQSVNAIAGNIMIGPGASGTGVISGTGGLNKTGPGTLTFGAMNIYSGDTILDGGTLA
jgi:autotransporter-associated beta strand protein